MDITSIDEERNAYESPFVLMVDLAEKDVIVTSGESGDDGGGSKNGDNNWTGEWDTDL